MSSSSAIVSSSFGQAASGRRILGKRRWLDIFPACYSCYHENMIRQSRDNMKTSKPRPKITGTLVGVRLQEPELVALDGWRKKQADLPTRPEAIRRLLGTALKIRETDRR
jgi:hypothetical protein